MTNTSELTGKRLGIFGFGQEGQAVAKYLGKHGLRAKVFDLKARSTFAPELIASFEDAGFQFVFEYNLKPETDLEFVFRSPGFWRNSPAFLEMEKAGVEISSQTKFFFKLCPAKIIGVTGTKGKGTTSTLIYEMLQAKYGKGIYLTGNIGKQAPIEILDELLVKDWVVFELSSFQLQDLDRSPHIGVCLMVTSEHLDIHQSLQEYREAKTSICRFQAPGDFFVYARDYEGSSEIADFCKGQKISYGVSATEYGVRIVGDKLEVIGKVAQTFDFGARKLLGAHNMENISASMLAARFAGVDWDLGVSVAMNFAGLEHRLEKVGTFSGVTFINDSFSTTPETTIAGVKSFTEPLVLIAGGSEKNADFQELARVLAGLPNLKELILIGKTAERIRQALEHAQFKHKLKLGLSSMLEVFTYLSSIVEAGDVVLLSPACASFDMFQNYIERGLVFKDLARRF